MSRWNSLFLAWSRCRERAKPPIGLRSKLEGLRSKRKLERRPTLPLFVDALLCLPVFTKDEL
jgi:hypothetical protein